MNTILSDHPSHDEAAEIADLVDRWHLFYNSEVHAQEVAFGKGVRFTVIDESRFGSFMRDIEDRG